MKYDTTFINRNFLLKVYGVDSENKRINRLVGVSGLVGLIGAFYGLCAGIAAAAGKELYDNFSKKGTPEVWDFIFSVVGVLAGVLNVLLARLVFHFIA